MCATHYLFLFKKLIYLFLAVLGLHCYAQALSSCDESGLLFVVMRSCGFSWWGAWGPGMQASVVATHGLLEHWLSSCDAGT